MVRALDFNTKSTEEVTEEFPFGVEGGCMAGFTFEKTALVLDWRIDGVGRVWQSPTAIV